MSRKFLVPVVLPADPVAALEAATKQYVDGKAAGLTPPAWAGPQPGSTVNAKFGVNSLTAGWHGFVIAATGALGLTTPSTEKVTFYNQPTAGGSLTWIGDINAARFQLADVSMGYHPTHNLLGVWKPSEGMDYLILRGSDGELLLDCAANASIYLRHGNTNMLTVNINQSDLAGNLVANRVNQVGTDWNTAHFVAYMNGGNQQSRMSLYSPGIAPQIRSVPANGQKLNVVDSGALNWAPVQASGFETVSTITTKRDVRELGVRPLRMERERIVVHHDVRLDTVPDVDIMALRPVAFRPRNPQLKIVPNDGISHTTDPDTWHYEPMDGILGHEGTRERLGLIAEEVETIIPSAVTHNRDGDTLAIDYVQVTVALLDHVQRLTDEVATLRYRVAELEAS